MNSSRATLAWLIAAALTSCFSLPQAAPKPNMGWTGPLEQMGLTGTLDSMNVPHNWRLKQVSSYDRTGGSQDDRYAEETFEGGLVLADLTGPGAIVRIWTRNPWGTLQIFVDDMVHPLATLPFADLFRGDLELTGASRELFSPPLVGEAGGGFYSYVPIPYKERCRLVLRGDNDLLGYQVTYAEIPAAAPLKSFKLALEPGDVRYFKKWRNAWEDYSFRYHDRQTETLNRSKDTLFPNSNQLILPLDGPGVITELEMSIGATSPRIFRDVWLLIYFDGNPAPSVLAPIGDFFGTTAKGAGYNGLVLGNEEGRMWCRYPMPFESSVEIRVVNFGTLRADFEYAVTWRPGPVGGTYHFFARYRTGKSMPGVPYRVAELTGTGHLAGCSLLATNAASLDFLSGDDILRIDGRPGSEFHGTGLDDYFNAGWQFSTGPFSTPTHGNTVRISSSPIEVGAFRTYITEAVPFTSSLVFDVEHAEEAGAAAVDYASVAYWYQRESQPRTWAVAEESLPLLRR